MTNKKYQIYNGLQGGWKNCSEEEYNQTEPRGRRILNNGMWTGIII